MKQHDIRTILTQKLWVIMKDATLTNNMWILTILHRTNKFCRAGFCSNLWRNPCALPHMYLMMWTVQSAMFASRCMQSGRVLAPVLSIECLPVFEARIRNRHHSRSYECEIVAYYPLWAWASISRRIFCTQYNLRRRNFVTISARIDSAIYYCLASHVYTTASRMKDFICNDCRKSASLLCSWWEVSFHPYFISHWALCKRPRCSWWRLSLIQIYSGVIAIFMLHIDMIAVQYKTSWYVST